MRTVHNPEHQCAFSNGYESKLLEIRQMGWIAARDKFNLDNPVGETGQSLRGYYHASGELEALCDYK